MTPNRWQLATKHKEDSTSFERRRSLSFGFNAKTGERVDCPYAAFHQGHFHIEGKPGSGKTKVTLLSIFLQALRGYRDETGKWSPKAPIIVFDLKGDLAFFHACRLAALGEGRVFRYVATKPGFGYHFFDPFQTFHPRHLTPVQLAGAILRAFGLDYGLGYGKQYFSSQNTNVLLEGVKSLVEEGGTFTLERLANALRSLPAKQASKDGEHVLLMLRAIAEYPQVNLSAHARQPAHQINMLRALEEGEVIFISFEMVNEAPTLRPIAGLLLDALVQAAMDLRFSGKPSPFTYVIADEFYHIAGSSFGEMLATSREWGLHFVLANQHRDQLKTHDPELPQVVEANTSVKQAYSINDPETVDRWKRLSGETIRHRRNYSLRTGVSELSGFSEYADFFLSAEDISNANDTHLRSLIYWNDGKSKRPGERVLITDGYYPLLDWQFQQYQAMPFPTVPEHELKRPMNQGHRTEQAKAPTPRQRSQPPNSELENRMNALWESIEAERHGA